MRARILASLGVVFALASATEASAGNNAAAAQALFEEARVLMASGSYAAACTKLEGSLALDSGPGTEYNLALCYEKSGRSASAWATYLSAAASYKSTHRTDWETRARDRAAALAGTLSKLTIVVPAGAPADLRITRDGTPVLASELGAPIPLDPGRHVVEAITALRPKFSASFDLPTGTNKTITVALADAADEAVDGGTTTSDRRPLAFALGGAGVVGLAVGAVSGIVAITKNASSQKDCPNDGPCKSPGAILESESASDWAAVSTVGFIAGGVLLAAGALVFLTAPKRTAHAPVAPGLWIGMGGAGVAGAW